MTIRNHTTNASQRRHFINRRCSVAEPTEKATTFPSMNPAGVTLRKYRPCGTLEGYEAFNSVGSATPTVNKVLSLRDK